MDNFERQLLRRHAGNVLALLARRRAPHPSPEIVPWLREHARLLGIKPPPLPTVEDEEVFGLSEKATPELKRWLAPTLTELRRRVETPVPSRLERRLRWLAATLRLSVGDAELLGAAVRCAVVRQHRLLMLACGVSNSDSVSIARGTLGWMLGRSQNDLRERLSRRSPLMLLGLLEDSYDSDFVDLSRTVLRVAGLKSDDPRRLEALLLGKSPTPELDWSDFDHLGEMRDLVLRVLTAALDRRAQGVNILIHGKPGTGKTEFVRTLGRKLDAHVAFVGETDDNDGEPSRSERVASFLLARALAGHSRRAVLVVDEADDVFLGVDTDEAPGRRGSKVFLNRLVESTSAPTIWITNQADRLGQTVLRRMSLALAFPEPGRVQRERIVARSLARRRLRLDPAATARLASLDAAPAILDQGLRVAKLVRGKGREVELAVGSIVAAMRGAPVPPITASLPFDPALSAADTDLAELGRRITEGCARTGRLDVSLCLYGLSGTGKSAFARHLAGLLGLDVLEKRASDLLGPYVGETEAQIAAAFRAAQDRRAILILDEADSFLRDRAGAYRSWEVTQVNEMLTWMERHPLPFVCTTNLMDSLDPATLRRFVFKVRFLPMSAGQAAAAFAHAFGLPAPAGLARLEPLTPGDFAVVARKAAILGERDPERLLAMLRGEIEAKPDGRKGPLGFSAA